jgi:pimeloyl-ACP methyl ester carboxylesterase
MSTIIYKNSNVSYTVTGNGPAVVLLHGFLENISMWNELIPHLAKKNQVICIDLPGHGKTDNLGYIHSMEDQAEMVKFVLDKLNIKKVTFIGHSMGGYVALAFAEACPDQMKGLCLLNSTALPDEEDKKLNRDRSISAIKQYPDTFVKLAIPNLFSEENKTRFRSEIEALTKEALKTSQQGIIAALEGMKIRKDRTFIFKNADYPIMMIISKKDPALDVRSLYDQLYGTNVMIHEFPDGHMSYIENYPGIIRVLTDFCEKCE